jgi:hypothetical protein
MELCSARIACKKAEALAGANKCAELWKRDLPGEDVVRLEAGRNGHHSLETEPEPAGSGQQNKCQGDLRNDETVTQDLSSAPARSTPTLRLNRITQMASRIEPSDTVSVTSAKPP